MQKFLTVFQILALLVLGAGMFAFARQMTVLTNTVSSTAASVAAMNSSPFTGPHAISEKELAQIHAAQQRMDVLAFNLAHARTIGFKRIRAELPPGPKQGNYLIDMAEGGLERTSSNLDVAIAGDGFFHIRVLPTQGDGTAYTRVGMLMLSKNGELLVNVAGGCPLIPAISLPPGATNISIAEDGTVSYTPVGSVSCQVAGVIQLYRFTNAPGLMSQDSFYFESPDSGIPIAALPGGAGSPTLMQGYLEQSNVSPVSEWAAMVSAQQELQLDRKATQLLEQTRQTVASLEKN